MILLTAFFKIRLLTVSKLVKISCQLYAELVGGSLECFKMLCIALMVQSQCDNTVKSHLRATCLCADLLGMWLY